MNSMTVAYSQLNFDTKKDCNQAILSFPEETEILSVEVRDNKSCLYINYMAPSENFEIDLSKKVLFNICKCNFTEIDVKRNRYIGNVVIRGESFAVFCN